MTGSNCRPSPCKGDALPTELITHKKVQNYNLPKKSNENSHVESKTLRVKKRKYFNSHVESKTLRVKKRKYFLGIVKKVFS